MFKLLGMAQLGQPGLAAEPQITTNVEVARHIKFSISSVETRTLVEVSLVEVGG